MEALKNDFFAAWEEEIAAYQEVELALAEQKHALTRWDIRRFQTISQETVLRISKAHKTTSERQDLLEAIALIVDKDPETFNLRHVEQLFEDEEDVEKAGIFFKVFTNTLKSIDKLSAENKELIRTGLEMVGDNLEMIADIIDHDKLYSRMGMMRASRSPLLINKRI